jgi:hypothetical protein
VLLQSCEIFATLGKSFSLSHIADQISCSSVTKSGAGVTSEFLLNDPEHWRTRAEEARILAKEMNDSESRDAMLRIAEDYEHLAQWVENWALRRLPKN